MKTNFRLLVLVLVVIIFVTSCDKKSSLNDNGLKISTEKIVDSTDEGLALYELKEDYVEFILEDVKEFLNFTFSVKELKDFKIEEISKNDQHHQYMYFTVVDMQGKEYITALELKEKRNPLEKTFAYERDFYVISHSCNGNPCKCCGFIFDSNNNIIGCDCKEGASGSPCDMSGIGVCNHILGSVM